MRKRWRRLLWVTGIITALASSGFTERGSARGQHSAAAPLEGISSSNRTKSGHGDKNQSINPARSLEIRIELAWLSDQETFPYLLEARVRGNGLVVAGTVPSKRVHDHAINIARLHSTLPVTDAILELEAVKERNAIKLARAQMESTAQTCLRETLGKIAKNVAIHCDSDGTLIVTGTLGSLEQKLVVSKALRRLHGCGGIANLAEIRGGEEVVSTSPSRINTVNPAAKKDTQKKGTWFGLFSKEPAEPESANAHVDANWAVRAPAQKPASSRDFAVAGTPSKDTTFPPPAVTGVRSTANGLSAPTLKKRIEEACPGLLGVQVTFISQTAVKLDAQARPDQDIAHLTAQILSLRELQDLHAELHFQSGPDR